MRMIMSALALVLAALVGNTARASPIFYTLTGDLTGTLTSGGSSITFTNTAFLWQVVGDTNNLTTIPGPPAGPAIPAITDTITIGATVLSPTIPTFFAWAAVPAFPPFGIAGFADGTTLQGLAWNAPALFTYNGVTDFGPLSVNFEAAGPLPTDGGSLDITGASSLVFTAVDEPPALALFLVGLGAVGVLAIKRRAVPV